MRCLIRRFLLWVAKSLEQDCGRYWECEVLTMESNKNETFLQGLIWTLTFRRLLFPLVKFVATES